MLWGVLSPVCSVMPGAIGHRSVPKEGENHGLVSVKAYD